MSDTDTIKLQGLSIFLAEQRFQAGQAFSFVFDGDIADAYFIGLLSTFAKRHNETYYAA